MIRMLYRLDWQIARENRDEIFARFVDSSTNPVYDLPLGLNMVGRWHDLACLSGTSIWDTDDVTTLMQWLQHWSDKVDMELSPCIEDDDASAICVATLTNY
jgi:hypothetical protein